MKTVVATLSILLAFPVANAQAAPRVSLELGSITVWLGMSKADVLSACAAVGYRAIEVKNGALIKNDSHTYDLEFKNGRVSYASRSWASPDKDYLDAAIGVLKGFDGFRCSISSQPLNKPDNAIERVFIVCGERSILLITGSIGKDRVGDVFERIGWTASEQ